jgi:hypothetical protein
MMAAKNNRTMTIHPRQTGVLSASETGAVLGFIGMTDAILFN